MHELIVVVLVYHNIDYRIRVRNDAMAKDLFLPVDNATILNCASVLFVYISEIRVTSSTIPFVLITVVVVDDKDSVRWVTVCLLAL